MPLDPDLVDHEMHELNLEADLLDQKTTVIRGGINGEHTKVHLHNSDPDAQAMVIESLRTQVQDLFSQVTQLNNKLVRSYDRVSDLEDELHITSSNLRNSSLKISQLELENTQHLSALSTGLLVEKSNVTAELTRLMERATEEAARRGQAESARHEIEKDLDDLSANLFDQANRMVAEARFARALSERKVEDTERALKGAEEVVGMLQEQMQSLQAHKEQSDLQVEEMRATMGKGKWIERRSGSTTRVGLRLICSHAPYQEFISFVAHLRHIRPATQQIPTMSTLLPLPFLVRLITEDSDPTVRLDMAPSLNWLTRRSVIAAIHGGQLTIEPMLTSTLLEELAPTSANIPGIISNTHITCALCGTSIIHSANAESPSPTKSSFPISPNRTGSWSQSIFKNSIVQSISNNPSSNHTYSQSQVSTYDLPMQIYIFRLATTSSSGLPVSLSQSGSGQSRPTIYPLCTSGWCLTRLRATCSLWAFVRHGIVEKVWEEDSIPPPYTAQPRNFDTPDGLKSNGTLGEGKRPTVTPRLSRMGIGALWGTMQRSLTPTSEGQESAKKDIGKDEPARTVTTTKKALPPAPPVHPSHSSHSSRSSSHQIPVVIPLPAGPPPPLPQRNKTRDANTKPPLPARPTVPSEDQVEAVRTASDESNATKFEDALETQHVDTVQSSPMTENENTTPTNARQDDTHAIALSTPLPTSPHVSPTKFVFSDAEKDKPATESAMIHPATAPRTPTTVPSSLPDAGSRTASPAPPPLPRRAPGRSRAMSVAVTPPRRSMATSPLPKTIDEAENASEDTKVSDAVDVKRDEQAEPVQKNLVPLFKTAEPLLEEDEEEETVQEKECVQEEEPAHEKEEPLLEEVPAQQEEAPVPEKETPVSEKEALVQDNEAPMQDQEAHLSEELVADATTDPIEADIKVDKEVELDETLDERSASPLFDRLSTNGLKDGIAGRLADYDDPSESDSASEMDGGVYVGDATWEDRTWKELVRLREEMFWARTGGIRY